MQLMHFNAHQKPRNYQRIVLEKNNNYKNNNNDNDKDKDSDRDRDQDENVPVDKKRIAKTISVTYLCVKYSCAFRLLHYL